MQLPNTECNNSHPTYIGGDHLLALIASLFGFQYKTASDEALDCAAYKTITEHRDHYVSMECSNISDVDSPKIRACYYRVLSGQSAIKSEEQKVSLNR